MPTEGSDILWEYATITVVTGSPTVVETPNKAEAEVALAAGKAGGLIAAMNSLGGSGWKLSEGTGAIPEAKSTDFMLVFYRRV